MRLSTQESPWAEGQVPTGGRVVGLSLDLATEHWRHERPTIDWMGGTAQDPMYRDVGDIVASGLAVGGGVVYFTAVGSGQLMAVDAASGGLLWQADIGPVFAGPALSRGRVYVGGGNTLFSPIPAEALFPRKYTGSVSCFGLPDDESKAPTRN